MNKTKPKSSKSFTAILVLTSATAGSSLIDQREKAGDGGGHVEDQAVDMAVVPSSSAESEPRLRRTRYSDNNGRQRVQTSERRRNNSRRESASKEESWREPAQQRRRRQSSSTEAAPGCGPTPGTHHSPYLGCYADRKNDRAFPYELHGGQSSAKRLGHGALDCERECGTRGFRYFGREFRGQCFCGDLIESIVRHGDLADGEGCDCCGENVGAGRMCVWENANHADSLAQLPTIQDILPHQLQSLSAITNIQSMHSYLGTLSFHKDKYDSNHNNYNNQPNSNNQLQPSRPINNIQQQSTPPNNHNNNNNQVAVTSSTHKPTGDFRLRLYWQRGYNWQNNPREQYYCMECRGSCKSGSSIQIDKCSNSARQKFIAVSQTVRPASNPSLCLAVSGYSGKRSPVKLRHCSRNGSSKDQNFREVRSDGRFELQPVSNSGRCLSQHHHPKPHEAVFPETCEKTRRHDTTYWKIY